MLQPVMPSKSQEQLYAGLRRGMQATEDLAVALPLLAQRREDLIEDAIARFNSRDPERKMTERDALLFVAALSENRKLKDDLEHTERQGRRDAAKLVG
jgi:hypothetical protein